MALGFSWINSDVRQRRYAGQNRAFQEFQARSAAGAHESHFVTEPGVVQGFDAVTAADDALGAVSSGFYHRSGHGVSALRKTRIFEHSHRTVPEDGASDADDFGIFFHR